MNKLTWKFPDGYNGDLIECYLEPIESNATTSKLQVVGSEYLIKWVSNTELEKATAYAQMEHDAYKAQETEYASYIRKELMKEYYRSHS